MKYCIFFLLIPCLGFGQAQNWPKEIKTQKGGAITIYQPQPESLDGNKLTGRSAFSAKEIPGDALVFGVFWYDAVLATDRDNRTANLASLVITNVKLPGVEDENKITKLKKLLETEIPKWEITASLDDIIATIDREQNQVSPEFKNEAPVIVFKTQPTTLITFDGEPRLQQDDKLKMKKVVNTPFLIVESPEDKKYYLYGGQYWYASTSLTENYKVVTTLPKSISALDQQLKKEQKTKPAQPETATPPDILISKVPTELIQTKGEAQFANIDGTSLLYITNSDNDIFKNINDQKYFVLLSGRWYASNELSGPWAYIPGDQLPADFAKIPEGSEKDNVLASVPGTQASKDAIMDAQIPQTAAVDRKKATCSVNYDGEPKFENIEGTSLQLAMNTSSTVLKSANKFYCVEAGVWFVADQAKGPWKVSDERPKDVEKIPASSKAYNTQYVYIFDSTPEVVYVGYTPGYMGCYVYGGTVVYGTGYYYNPWYGPYYYPAPVTYGFSMHYNPWMGWSMGFHYSTGCFSFSVYGGGYWGPPMYRPPYHPPYHGGIYGGRGPVFINNGNINIDRGNNIYNGRNGASTRDVKRGQGGQGGASASQLPANRAQGGRNESPTRQPATGPRNDVYGDRNGNVYQRQENGNWNQRNGDQWKQTNQSDMNRDYQNRERSSNQNSGFQQMNRAGGGMRGGGGGGGRRR